MENEKELLEMKSIISKNFKLNKRIIRKVKEISQKIRKRETG